MLKNVSIQNYRLFDDFSIDNMARVNLVVGKNNVGKSSLLEALYLLVSQDSPDALLKLLETRGEFSFVGDAYRSRSYDIAHLFFGHELESGASIVIQSKNLESLGIKITFLKNGEQLALSSSVEAPRRRGLTLLRLEYLTTERKIDVDLIGSFLDSQQLEMFVNPDPTQINFITTKGFDYDFLAKSWDTITLTPKEDDVINMLKILEPDIERISFQSRKTSSSGILIRHKDQNAPLPLGSMGDGIHRILAIAIALANSENGYLFIDEIDTGLHYRTITNMWNLVFKTAEKLNIQVFATTHSLDCIDAFGEAINIQKNRDIGKLFRLERRGGKIETVEYNAEDLTVAIQQEIEVR